MTEELQFVHRVKTKREKADWVIRKLRLAFPDGNFELRGLNIYGVDPKKSRDYLAGYCYGLDREKKVEQKL